MRSKYSLEYVERWIKEHPDEPMIRGARQPVEGTVGPTVELGELNIAANSFITIDSSGDAQRLAHVAGGQILIAQGTTTVPSWNAVSGDITIDSAGAVAIASGVIVAADVSGSAAIEFSKLEALTDGNILVGNASNVAASVNPSGDVDISNSGVFSIASEVIVNADVSLTADIAKSKIDSAGTWANAEIANLPTLGTNPSPARQTAITNAELDGNIALSKLQTQPEANATADQTDAEIETAYNNQVGAMSQATAEAGTSTTIERITALRIKQAIDALAAGGGVDLTTKGDIHGYDTTQKRIPIGANDEVLTADSAQALGLKWAAAAAAGTPTAITFSTMFETGARFGQNVSGGGSIAFDGSGVTLLTSATGGGIAELEITQNNIISTAWAVWTMNFKIGFDVRISTAGTDYQACMGIGNPTIAAGGITFTIRHVGIKAVRAAGGAQDESATNANGTTETATNIGTDANLSHLISIISTSAEILFYRDNSLVATHTTNLPTGTINEDGLQMGVTNVNVASGSDWEASAYSLEVFSA